jgi:hypothetical protein
LASSSSFFGMPRTAQTISADISLQASIASTVACVVLELSAA